MVNVYLSVLNRKRIILHRAFRHFQCFLKFFRRTKSEKGYLTTTYRFLKRLFAVQIYRSTSDCSLANISDIASRRYRFQLCVNRAYFTGGVTATYPSSPIFDRTAISASKISRTLPRSRSFGQMKGHKNISHR